MTMPPTMLMAVMRRPATASPAHELRGAVHRAEEGGLVLQGLPASARRVLVDQADREVGVDRHLLPRHRVEREAGRDLGDPPRALGDDDEVHDDEDREHDQPDDVVPAHHEAAERLDDVARPRPRPSCPRARMRRVEARFNDSRSIVAMRSTVGNEERTRPGPRRRGPSSG